MLTSLALAVAALPSLIPLPQKVDWHSGEFVLDRGTTVVGEGTRSFLLSRLREATGLSLPSARQAGRSIVLKRVDGMAPEAYTLTVSRQRIQVNASSDAGHFNGIQTLRQLNQGSRIPACRIEDAPRFAWRGLLLDESRHFFGGKGVRKFIDNMS